MSVDSPVSIVWVTVEDGPRALEQPPVDGVDDVLPPAEATDRVAALDDPSETCVVAVGLPGLAWFRRCADVLPHRPPALLVVDDAGLAEAAASGPVDEIIWQDAVTDRGRFALRVRQTVDSWSGSTHPTVSDFEPLVEHAQDLITVVDPDGRIRYANPAVEDILGYDRDEFVGSPVFDYVHPDDRREVAAETEAVLEESEALVSTSVYRARHADGSWRWLESVSQSEDLTAPVDGYVVSTRDVTERVERESRLRRERETTENVLESIEDAYFVLDRDGHLQRWNSTVETVLDRTASELDGLDLHSVFADADRSRLDEHLAAVTAGETRTIQLDVRTGRGELRPYEFKTSPFVVDGEVAGICGIGRDVTEREARAEQLRRTERRFQAVFDDPMSFLGILDTDGRLLDVNDRACEFAGVTADEATGHLFWRLPWWDHSDAEQDRISSAIERAADGEFVRFKTTNVGDDGEVVHLDTSLRPVVRDDGTVASIVVEGIDISEEVRANRERELLLDAIQSAARSPDLEAALTETLRTVVTSTNVVYGEAWLPDGEELRLQNTWWTADPELEPFGRQSETFRFAPGVGLPGRVWASGNHEWVLDLGRGTDAQLPRLEESAHFGLESAVGMPVLGTDGSVLTVLVFLTDTSQGRDDRFLELLETITAHLGAILQRKVVEDELAAERERQQRLLETSPVGILVVGSDGELEQENQRARDIFGVDETETLAAAYDREPWRVTPTTDDGPELENGWFREVAATGTAIRNEVYVVDRADGERLWLLVNAAPVGGEEGEVIVSFSDITEQKRHEQAFQNQAERVSVLNRVLRHDLRTHLTVVGGLLDRITEQADVPMATVEAIRQSLADLETLSHRARRIEAAFESETRTSIDLGSLAERVVADAADTYPHAAVTLTEASGPPVLAHEHFRLVLDNLLENAVVHHDGDDPSVEVSVARRDETTVRLVVSDDGPGIPESEIELRESRLETALDHSDGLGLWIVRWLVSKSDGELRLERSEDGSRAVVLLPVAPGAE
ncbi:PAS domain-containing protein [Haloarchaeobius salinus]|uniref:PAS domain-containing protein n=1 Tax=Haloarchaeobius salinus TaxID=1198298 RepID=UPI00210B6951|nr:PAS domain-containing protein [Haloarchaeobius salinus]